MGAGREIPSLRLIQAREYGHNKQREGESRQERDRLGPPLRRGQEKKIFKTRYNSEEFDPGSG